MSGLDDQLARAARSPNLLLACDYDGTLAPIVADPAQAHPNSDSLRALQRLAGLPNAHVAVISGRSLTDLRRLLGNSAHMHLVGSHGGEFDSQHQTPLAPEASKLRNRILHDLNGIAMRDPGFLIEEKPASIAFHYRNADATKVQDAIEAILAGPAKLEGVTIRSGKKVIELSVTSANKGYALQTLCDLVHPTCVIFIGDDITDEDAFAALHEIDIGIKVGPGETKAKYRIADTNDVAQVLSRVVEIRSTLK